MTEILSLITLFMVDDEMIEFFISTDIVKHIKKMLVDDIGQSQSTKMNIIIILKSIFDHKPYAFSKQLKIELLVFLLRNYARETDSMFKSDLIGVLIAIYESRHFRELISEKEVKNFFKGKIGFGRVEEED